MTASEPSSSPSSPTITLTNVAALNLQKNPSGISTGIGFFDHMLDQFNSHAQIGVSVQVEETEQSSSNDNSDANRFANPPELQLDIMSQVGQALGAQFYKSCFSSSASSGCKGSTSRFCCPLDEALVECVISLNSDSEQEGSLTKFTLPPYGIYPPNKGRSKIGQMNTTPNVQKFFEEFAKSSHLNVSLHKIRGDNGHHIVESAFKAFSRAIRNLMDGTTTYGTEEEMDGNVWGKDSLSYKESLALKREAQSSRKTKETSIDVTLKLNGGESGSTSNGTTTTQESGVKRNRDESEITVGTGIQTLDKFYQTLAQNANLSLSVQCNGDTWVDDHHTSEDISIAIGKVLNTALGTKAGLNRMWCSTAKVGKAEVEVTMDLSNRPCLTHDLSLDREYVGDMSVEMLDHVLDSLVMNGQMTVHIVEKSSGGNDTGDDSDQSLMDITMATAEAFGTALKYCAAVDPRRAGKTASSKGTLSA